MKSVRIFYVIQMSWPENANVVYVKNAHKGKVCLSNDDAEKFDDINLAEDAAKAAFKQIAKSEDGQFLIKPVMVRETVEIIDPYTL